jgi:hypothetical protein
MKLHRVRTIGLLSALLISNLLLTASNAAAEREDAERGDRRAWTDVRYAVTRAELKKIFAMPPITMAAFSA